jgi:hypothetical protein
MSRSERFLGLLETTSDLLSPIVVKEVRQVVRGREFTFSVSASLIAGLAVAFFGAADALTGTGTSGRWTFGALMGCLTLLGLAVVPLGAFTALRVERLEQTLELITLTALTPRRVVIGKLLAQGVKLATLFAAMAPFIAMSFLLGGIDFATILVSLAILFMWSLWMSSAGLFLSSLLKSRAMMGIVLGGAAIVLLVLVVSLGRMLFVIAIRGALVAAPPGFGLLGAEPWWALAVMTTFCIASMVNLVLLAENRLSLPTGNRVTPLRVGFLVQFLLIAGWTLSFVNEPLIVRSNVLEAFGVIGGLHLMVVAMFTVTEDLVVPRRVLRSMTSSRWRPLLAIFRPGGGRGAAYVLMQMALLFAVAWPLLPTWIQLRWLLALCGYICFFTGVPTLAVRYLRPEGAATLRLRVGILLLLPASLLLPDLVHYVLWRPDVLNLGYSARHLFNPIRTLTNWPLVETYGWQSLPFAFGVLGVLAYLGLIHLGMSTTAEVASGDPQDSAAEAGEHRSANVLY